MAKRVVICGSTGSIGEQALDVIAGSDELELVGLSAATNWERLVAQAREQGVGAVAVSDPAAAERAGRELDGARVLAGDEGVRELIATANAELILNAIVGTAGLGPTIVALTEGITLALANKESLVVGGELVTALAEATETRILPVDSEHSAIFQLLRGRGAGDRRPPRPHRLRRAVSRPHRPQRRGRRRGARSPDLGDGRADHDRLGDPVQQGLGADRGPSSLRRAYERIDVVVHPQSIVHSLIELNDGAQLAHLGLPDMRVPISYALHYPERADVTVPRLDLAAVGRLEFEPPDLETFPCLRLAREAGLAGGTAPCALNAADEVAVAAFLDGRIAFTAIPEVIAGTLGEVEGEPLAHFEQLFDCDARAREVAAGLVERAGVGA